MDNRIKHIFSLLILFGWGLALGQTEEHVSVMRRIHIIPNGHMSVSNAGQNDPTGSPGAELLRENYTAVVTLIYGRELLTDIDGDEWGFRVEYNLVDQGSNIIANGSNTIQRFPANTIYLDYKHFDLAEGYVKLVVTGIFTTEDNWQNETNNYLNIVRNVPDDIRLELRIETNRFDYLDPASQLSAVELTQVGDDILIEWDHMVGAESYQVEFEFQTDDLHPGFSDSPSFKNAARVEVRLNYYLLTATYPEGALYVRVRPTGRHVRNGITSPESDFHKVVGQWSAPESISGIDFQPDINWQSTTAYAEDGKFKKNVDYFDDGLKQRQSVTNLSSESMVIRSATHYDFEGRPVISVLPAPDLSSNSFGFVAMLDELLPEDFEDLNGVPDVGTLNGAGLYYSSSNIGNLGVHTQYVPDAEGFPYSRMKYLNDGTGRIKSQSGVGALYQLNGEHDTEYFYDDPSETQLRRLFGKNVGLARYYRRNIVKDPNGQLSVSYVDIAGNTIATALAGNSPSNVQALESEVGFTITENLIENGVVDTAAGVSTVTTTLFNEVEGTDYFFCYSLTGINVEHESTICQSCSYMLVFKISDPCGNDVALPADTVIFSGEDLCTNPTFIDSVPCFTLTFDSIGLYTVTKSLSIIPLSIEEWMEELKLILPDSNYFIEQYLAAVDTTECIQSCDQFCRDTLLAIYPFLEGQELEDSIAACVFRECLDSTYTEGSLVVCDAIHTQMIYQLSEGGCLYSTWNETPSALSQLTFIVDGEEVPGMEMHEILVSDLIWEDSWADTLATIHPDYDCCYAFCLSMADSREFDYKLPFLYSWSDVSSDPTFIVGEDPFFQSGGPGAGLMTSMETAIDEYGTDNGNNPDGCPTPNPLDLVSFINCILSGSSDADKWETYISLYSGLKQEFVDDVACVGTTTEDCTACMEIPEEYTDIADVDDAVEFGNDGIVALCTDVCMGQAEMIANIIFETCSDGSWQELYDTLYNHCIMNCGFQNPLGYFLEEDLDEPSMEDVVDWLTTHGCDVDLFDSLIVVPFDSVYMALGYPQNAGIDVIDTICMRDSINLYVLHDSLYIHSLDSLYADSLIGDQMFLIDTGLYYFIGFDSTCCALMDTSCFNQDSAVFEWFGMSDLWAPGDLLGAWPELSGFEEPGCYTFGFYTPSMAGACSDYSEVTIYVPGCDEPELIIDSLDNCVALAYLEYGEHTGPIDTIIWSVSIDGDPEIPYTEGDTLSSGMSYVFIAKILYSACCDPLGLIDSLVCDCGICTEQFVEIGTDRFDGIITYTNDTLMLGTTQLQCMADDSVFINMLVAELDSFLAIFDTCGIPDISWSFDSTNTECWRIVISGSSILFNYMYLDFNPNPIYYFDTTGCDSVIILFNPPPDEQLATRSPGTASITLYPNPARGSFYLEFEHDYEIKGRYEVQIADFSGTLLYAESFPSDGSFDRRLIDVSSLPPGVYKVIVRDAQGYYSTTIVLMR